MPCQIAEWTDHISVERDFAFRHNGVGPRDTRRFVLS
jgi:hypothetical protein